MAFEGPWPQQPQSVEVEEVYSYLLSTGLEGFPSNFHAQHEQELSLIPRDPELCLRQTQTATAQLELPAPSSRPVHDQKASAEYLVQVH